MKTLTNILFFIAQVQSYKVLKPFSNTTNLPIIDVFRDVVRELYIRPNIPFDIVTFRKQQEWQEEILINIRQALKDVPLTFRKIKDFSQEELVFNQSAIIVGIGNDVKKFNLNVRLLNEYPKDLRFLIYTKKINDIKATQ
ncbi:hypothetical protein PVAND_003014 [Polypedilum vanderplanki]|uniref:Uncharacterized protein n=1 Tax=Polypedilum vanderplanki TaxID=319348 RepID=A0A9J6BUF5_POLVA|nr:hypothetical protein PVAND_003014 [Polypedilum vanderplanki]